MDHEENGGGITALALNCNYHRGTNYLEIDVDIGSSAIASAILHLVLGGSCGSDGGRKGS
ncbi:hypothetical protein G4B88_017231 [Cannabis sativa]|uniref:Protein ENHANCED DISEASE RESISTANCE 2 C-terminal domain-containing protein n=1 Tax=Cannabis sativa TaxID=3483 RepID=A0A7J6G0J3_CANSA|nr:hypothetical protein G4B88_019335 [Cannabis sativa]KAF4376495.1 hypothetical protein G4B88_017231 [Cannabis sativa]